MRTAEFPGFCLRLMQVLAGAGFLSLVACERPQGGGDEPVATEAPQPEQPVLSDIADTVPPPPPDPMPEKMAPLINKDARVSILGYHDFTDGGRGTSDMVIHVDDFRAQMQMIKDAGLPVISMQEYLAWRRDEAPIPDQCVMITIDDGWKATHTLALPVLREFGFPFTIFLYKKYVGIGGRSLTYDEVRELMAGGATVGSHSVSHISMINRQGKGDEDYEEWLRVELEDSFEFLEENFGSDGEVLKVFAYPFGIYSERVVEKAQDFGYQAAFTVNGKKTTWDTPPLEVGRYIVYGEKDQNFSAAMAFGGGSVLSSGRKLMEASTGGADGEEARGPLVKPYPQDGESVTERRPVISLDVSGLDGVEPESIVMRVTGFGQVRHHYDEGAGVIRYQVPMKLRTSQCGVLVRLRHAGNDEVEEIGWNFSIDRIGSYLEGIRPELLSDSDAAATSTTPARDEASEVSADSRKRAVRAVTPLDQVARESDQEPAAARVP